MGIGFVDKKIYTTIILKEGDRLWIQKQKKDLYLIHNYIIKFIWQTLLERQF